jgi:hypothetical protein
VTIGKNVWLGNAVLTPSWPRGRWSRVSSRPVCSRRAIPRWSCGNLRSPTAGGGVDDDAHVTCHKADRAPGSRGRAKRPPGLGALPIRRQTRHSVGDRPPSRCRRGRQPGGARHY